MKINNLRSLNSPHFRPSRPTADRVGVKAALLGAACVCGVFGLLGLLYAVG